MVILAGSCVLAIAIFSLLRFSSMYSIIGVRNAITTKSLGEVLGDPFDVFFSNLGTIISTLVVFMTPLLFAAALGGLAFGSLKRWRPSYFLWLWALAVALIEGLVAKHWMFNAILPRFYLSLLPPLLLGAACLAAEGIDAAKGWRPERKGGVRAAVALALILLLAFPVYTDVMVLADPSDAVLPYWIRVQYITDWHSGWGIKEFADYIASKSKEGPVIAGTNLRSIGLPTDGIEMYLQGNKNVRVVPFGSTATEFPPQLRAGTFPPTYVVFNSIPGHERPPADWPLELIRSSPRTATTTSTCTSTR